MTSRDTSFDCLSAAVAGRYRHRARARPRRHGHGLSRARPQARPAGRAQGAPPRAGRTRSAPSASCARSELAARLQHPHILPVHDSGRGRRRGSGTPCRTSRASRLRDRLRAGAAAPARGRAADRARGGRRARLRPPARRRPPRHQAGEHPAHRGGHALVADFGIARALERGGDDAADRDRARAGHARLHEPRAGERRARARRAGATSTAWAACCTRCWPGEPPFTGPHRAGGDRPPAAGAAAARCTWCGATVPERLERVVSRALARAPADRFASTAEFAGRSAAASLAGSGQLAARRVATTLRSRSSRRLLTARARHHARAGCRRVGAALATAGALPRPSTPTSWPWRPSTCSIPARALARGAGGPALPRPRRRGAAPHRLAHRHRAPLARAGRPESAAALGRRTGAGLALYGSLVRSGAGLAAARRHRARRGPRAPQHGRGSRCVAQLTDWTRLTDSVAVGVLREL